MLREAIFFMILLLLELRVNAIMDIVIKYATIIACSHYSFIKLLHIETCRKQYFQFIFFLAAELPIIYFLRLHATSLSIVFFVISLIIFVVKIYKISLNSAITTSIISVGFSFLTFYVAAFPGATVAFILRFILPGVSISFLTIIGLIASSVIQMLLVIIPFRIKRFRKGMPFLVEYGASDVGVYISFTSLVSASFLSNNENSAIEKFVPFILILISGMMVLFWWQKKLNKKYIDKVKAQEIQALQETITQQETEIEKLKHHNNELSKIIHKDNKLIPALEYAVRQYLLTVESETDSAARLVKGKSLLSQIESVSKERTGIITSYESNSKRLPSTGVLSIDSLLMYMLQRSKEQQIDFNLSLSGSVKYLIDNIATEQDINTLLADLIENAIIATKKCVPRNILVHIGIADNCYSIGIFDNGIAFTRETIKDIGLKRTTTHAGEGGSGIGLMTTFEILKKHKASFVIEDIADNVLYTKNVSVCFDNLGQLRIKSKLINKSDLYHGCEDLMLMRDLGA